MLQSQPLVNSVFAEQKGNRKWSATLNSRSYLIDCVMWASLLDVSSLSLVMSEHLKTLHRSATKNGEVETPSCYHIYGW